MEVLVQENITALEVSVYNRWINTLMKIFQTFCCFKCYSHSCIPIQF
uniref:Uncharacterized protein n=1 Tax=Arundo donax TaxID=35708 RepID=A0A0A9HH61_ARUDO